MYDILQLNDMLVPELLDIAEQLKIPNAKKLNKQDLIYKVLDKQAVTASDSKNASADDKGKKKRIIKTTTANSTEEAVVESGDSSKEAKKEPPRKKIQEKPAEKPHAHAAQAKAKGKRKPEGEEQREMTFTPRHKERPAQEENQDNLEEEGQEEELIKDDSQQDEQPQASQQNGQSVPTLDQPNRNYPQRRERGYPLQLLFFHLR